MTDNLRIWNQCKEVPIQYLKQIQAGRLKGKSDISPQWRMRIMTEMYGPCGVGWKYTIDRLWTEKGHGEEVFAFAQISLYIKDGDTWSEPIPGIGGHFLIEQESRGPHNNDEAYKMATTDALGVAMKALGVAADIYLGLFDGSKYMKEANKEGHVPRQAAGSPKPSEAGSTPAPSANPSPAGDIVILYIEEIEKKEGINAKTKKPWTSWSLKVGNTKWGTFRGSIAALAEEAKAAGKPVEVTYIVKEFAPGKSNNEIVTLKILDDTQETKEKADDTFLEWKS